MSSSASPRAALRTSSASARAPLSVASARARAASSAACAWAWSRAISSASARACATSSSASCLASSFVSSTTREAVWSISMTTSSEVGSACRDCSSSRLVDAIVRSRAAIVAAARSSRSSTSARRYPPNRRPGSVGLRRSLVARRSRRAPLRDWRVTDGTSKSELGIFGSSTADSLRQCRRNAFLSLVTSPACGVFRRSVSTFGGVRYYLCGPGRVDKGS